jgi:hypothetical protein
VSSENDVKFNISFEHYVTAVLSFRYRSDEIADVSSFAFWSLRNCVVYGARRTLQGNERYNMA